MLAILISVAIEAAMLEDSMASHENALILHLHAWDKIQAKACKNLVSKQKANTKIFLP